MRPSLNGHIARKNRKEYPNHQSGYLSVYPIERKRERKKEKRGGETYYFLFSCGCLEIILQISLLQLAQTNRTVMTYSHEDRNYFIKSVGRYS